MIPLTGFGFFLLGCWASGWQHQFPLRVSDPALLLAVIVIAVCIVWHGIHLSARRDPHPGQFSGGMWAGLAMQAVGVVVSIGVCLDAQEPLVARKDWALAALAAMLGGLGVVVTAFASLLAAAPEPPSPDQDRP